MLKAFILLCVMFVNAFSMEPTSVEELSLENYPRVLAGFRVHFAEWCGVEGSSRPQAKAKYLAGVAFFKVGNTQEPDRSSQRGAASERDEIRYGYDLAALDIIVNEPSLFNTGLNQTVLMSVQTQARSELQKMLRNNENEGVRNIAQSILNRSTQCEHSNP